jgi:hypothetical protein
MQERLTFGIGLAAFATRQPADDLAAMLEDIEMPPRQHLGVV